MRSWWVLAVLGSGCTCSQQSPPPAASDRPAVVAPAAVPNGVKVVWQQRSLSPTRTEVAAVVSYGPSSSPLAVQLEFPQMVQVTSGRTYFTLPPTAEPKQHLESFTFVSPALPVQDVVLVVTGASAPVRAAYRFGRQ